MSGIDTNYYSESGLKSYQTREKIGVEWLLRKGCDPLKSNSKGDFPIKYMAALAYPAKEELSKEEDDISERDESSRVTYFSFYKFNFPAC